MFYKNDDRRRVWFRNYYVINSSGEKSDGCCCKINLYRINEGVNWIRWNRWSGN